MLWKKNVGDGKVDSTGSMEGVLTRRPDVLETVRWIVLAQWKVC